MPEKKRIIVGVANIPEGVVEAEVRSGQVDWTKLNTSLNRAPEVVRIPADATSGATWTVNLLSAVVPGTVVYAGIIPDTDMPAASTDHCTLILINKGLVGAGSRSMVSKSFSGITVSGNVLTSLGTIASAYVASGEVLALQKTVNLSGEAVPASVIAIYITRGA